MTVIIDYGVGNLFSLTSSLRAIGEEALVTDRPELIQAADRLILPGVGAFGDAAEKLRAKKLDGLLAEQAAAGKPLLGICLGMQLLFRRSFEYGEHQGLGLLEGDILPFSEALGPEYKIPHIGWNAIRPVGDCPLFKYVHSGDCVYFVHSYYAPARTPGVAALTEYGLEFCSAAAQGKVFGCQFHPEKSGAVGLGILRGFVETEGGPC